MSEPDPFDELLNAMLTKPGPSSPSEDQETDQDDVKDGDGE